MHVLRCPCIPRPVSSPSPNRLQFLDTLIFAVYSMPSDTSAGAAGAGACAEEQAQLLESYTFKVVYPDETPDAIKGIEVTRERGHSTARMFVENSKKGIKKSTVTMIRTLVTLAQTLKPLPDER